MRKAEYHLCKDELSMMYLDILELSLQVGLGEELISLESIQKVVSVLPNYDRQKRIEIGQKIISLLEKVSTRKLDETGLIREWEKITNTETM